MRLRLGLAAWSNAHFDHALYPLQTPHAEYLPRYATLFDCAEADILHHRDADEGTLADWIEQTPPDFLFLPKMSKAATHAGAPPSNRPDPRRPPKVADPDAPSSLDAARAALDALVPLEKSGRLGPVLLQFPPSLDRVAGWDLLARMLPLRPEGSFAVEFRGASWFVPAVEHLLEDFDAPLVWSTWPKAFAPPWRTASKGYIRFTGTHFNTRGRHVQVADRLGDILEIRKRLEQASWKECFAIVTNPFEGNAVDSIPRIAAALGAPDLAARMRRGPGQVLFPDP